MSKSNKQTEAQTDPTDSSLVIDTWHVKLRIVVVVVVVVVVPQTHLQVVTNERNKLNYKPLSFIKMGEKSQ